MPRPTRRLAILLVVATAACAPATLLDSQAEEASLEPVPVATDADNAPPIVIPLAGLGAPTLRIRASGIEPIGFEGALYFVRAAPPGGRVVLQRQWEWPTVDQRIPAGRYQVTIYTRMCDANCGFLDPPTLSCSVGLLAEPFRTYAIEYHVPDGINSAAAICALVR